MVTAELAHQSANLGRADESYFNSLPTTHFLFSGKKRKEPVRGKKRQRKWELSKRKGP
jgi:hypothetical protein